MKRRAALFAACCIGTMGVSAAIRPSRRAADSYVPIKLEDQIPKQVADWSIDKTILPVLPDPGIQASLNKIYTQTLARTYRDQGGARVMLSIVYGADQGSDATQAHRPEFCYAAQGFVVKPIRDERVSINRQSLVVRRMLGTLGSRFEPITYWLTLNDTAVLPGLSRKLQQIRLGLSGQIPDGMLVRVSTVGLPQEESFQVQDTFLSSLETTLVGPLKARYFGRTVA